MSNTGNELAQMRAELQAARAQIVQLKDALTFDKRVIKAACETIDELTAQLAKEVGKSASASELVSTRETVAGRIESLMNKSNSVNRNLLTDPNFGRVPAKSDDALRERIAKRAGKTVEEPGINYPLGG